MIYHGAGERGLEHGAEGGGVWEGPLWHGLGRATVLPPVRAALSGHRPWVALESLLGVSSLEEARRQPCPTFFFPLADFENRNALGGSRGWRPSWKEP